MRIQSFALALATAVLAVPAAAAEDQPPRVAVHYADLDLTSEAGRSSSTFASNVRHARSAASTRRSSARTCARRTRANAIARRAAILDQEFAQAVTRKSAGG
jgi:UrcA family protein